MAQTVFKRELIGQQSGVQVNLPIDRVERMLPDTGMQTFATVGRFARGRIDKPFLVSANQFYRYLGFPSSVRSNSLNSTAIQVFDALQNGAAAVVASRVAPATATNKFWLVNAWGVGNPSNLVTSVPSSAQEWYVAIRIADCITDGVYATVGVGETDEEVAIKIQERSLNSKGEDTAGGEILYEFSGSLKSNAKDEMGNSKYIVDVAHRLYGDWVEVVTNTTPINQRVQNDALFKTNSVSGVLMLYSENGQQPATTDYIRAAEALGKTRIPYRYILSESNNIALVNALLNVSQKYNRIMAQEISGSLSPDAAIRWKDTFQYDAQGGMYGLWIWSPIKRQDPTGISGVYQFPTVGQKIGKACKRNAQVNAFGLPPLNQPIAGKDFYLTGTRFESTYEPDDVELAALAKAHINPVQYVEYHDGSGFVWDDSLSGSKKNGISRLESVVEISQWVQETFGKFARSLLQTPMTEALRKMERFTIDQCQAMEASEWLTPSQSLDGRSYSYVITPSSRSPEDEMLVTLNLSIDGVVRRIIISQNMYSRT